MAAKTKRAAKQGSKPSAASKMAQPIPAGYPPITPYLRVRNAQQALALYSSQAWLLANWKALVAAPRGER